MNSFIRFCCWIWLLCFVLLCLTSLFDWTWFGPGGKLKNMLLLLWLIWLYVISGWIWINFPSLNTSDVKWLLLEILDFHNGSLFDSDCFLIGYIQQFYSLIKQSNLFNCKTEKKQNKKKTTTTTVKGKNCF